MLKQSDALRGLQTGMGKMFAAIPLSPNQWTVLSLVAAVAAAFMVAQANLVLGLVLFALAGAFDLIDGAVARARSQVTELGGFIDGIADRFVEAFFLFSFMFYPLPAVFLDSTIWIAFLIFFGTCMPSFIRAYAEHKSVISKEKALALGGICERSERIIILVLGLGAGLLLGMEFFVYSVMLAILLSIITILQRLAEVSRR